MAAPAGGSVIISSLITAAGDVTEKGLDITGKLLSEKIVLEFGAEGFYLKGRTRPLKDGSRSDGRTLIKRVEIPLVTLLVVAWLVGWRPGGAIGQFLEFMFGKGPPPKDAEAWAQILDAALRGTPFGFILQWGDLLGVGIGPQQ